MSFSDCFSKTKTEECDQKVCNVIEQFGVVKPCSITYFMKVAARVSLKLSTEGILGHKRTLKSEVFRLLI